MSEVAGGLVVGRDRELERLRAVLDAPSAWPAALLLEGIAGAGKTALWSAGVELARDRRVLRARPTGAEAQLAFSALGDLLEGLPGEVLAALPGLQRRALEAALLVGDEDEPGADMRAVGVAVLGVLRRLAAERPVLLAIDDEQWLDGPSAAALTFALRRLRDEPVLALMTRRTAAEDGPGSGLATAFGAGRVTRIAVGPVELEPLRLLIEARLGVSWTRPVLVRILATSGGNPLYALELARALARGDPAVPATLRGLLSERLARLPPGAADLLALAAAGTSRRSSCRGRPWSCCRDRGSAERSRRGRASSGVRSVHQQHRSGRRGSRPPAGRPAPLARPRTFVDTPSAQDASSASFVRTGNPRTMDGSDQ